MAFTDRTFGVEIEFVGDRDKAVRAIRAAGLRCYEESYNSSHPVPSDWKVTTDASIGYENGELVSPILKGEEGLEQVRKALKALRGIGHSVNRNCGVHVHVGARDLSAPEIVNVFKRYQKFEGEIDGFMPVSRRANNNSRFIASLVNLNLGHATTPNEVRSAMHACRYFKLNVMSYFRQKTLEFRQHSGSLSGEKVCNWVKFCVNFVEASRATSTASVSTTTSGRRGRRPSDNSAKAKVADFFRTQSHYLYDSLLAGLGLNPVSLPAVISGLRSEGWVIRRSRLGNYYHCSSMPVAGTPAQASVIQSFETVGDNLFTGLDDSTIQFFRERAAEFAEQ